MATYQVGAGFLKEHYRLHAGACRAVVTLQKGVLLSEQNRADRLSGQFAHSFHFMSFSKAKPRWAWRRG